ncbi:MAG: hypothetical protein ACI89U_000650, partial [Gammaproteobacteria bacterium]
SAFRKLYQPRKHRFSLIMSFVVMFFGSMAQKFT